jgi:hypothetical protein
MRACWIAGAFGPAGFAVTKSLLEHGQPVVHLKFYEEEDEEEKRMFVARNSNFSEHPFPVDEQSLADAAAFIIPIYDWLRFDGEQRKEFLRKTEALMKKIEALQIPAILILSGDEDCRRLAESIFTCTGSLPVRSIHLPGKITENGAVPLDRILDTGKEGLAMLT